MTLFSDLSLYPQWNMVAPAVPTVTVAPGNTEVTVTPTPVAASGTTVGPTTSILVTAFNNSNGEIGKTCTVVMPATSCVITGLTNGITYKFAAKAINTTATTANSALVSGKPLGILVTFDATTNSGSLVTNVADIKFLSNASNISTITTYSAHNFSAGDTVEISTPSVVSAAVSTYVGTYKINSIVSATVFTIVREYADQGQVGGGDAGQTIATRGNVALHNKAGTTTLSNANRPGYIFSGWYTAATGGALVGGSAASYAPLPVLQLATRV